jgi:hypothetical protein
MTASIQKGATTRQFLALSVANGARTAVLVARFVKASAWFTAELSIGGVGSIGRSSVGQRTRPAARHLLGVSDSVEHARLSSGRTGRQRAADLCDERAGHPIPTPKDTWEASGAHRGLCSLRAPRAEEARASCLGRLPHVRMARAAGQARRRARPISRLCARDGLLLGQGW